jgi:FG-GAP repeat
MEHHAGRIGARFAQGRLLRGAACLLAAGLLLAIDGRMPEAGWSAAARLELFVQQGDKLTGGGETGNGQFGYSVALSADGSTALIGARLDDGGRGAAWIFARSGSTWSQQGSRLTGSGEAGNGQFGSSVALSADGSTALVGGVGDNASKGAVWVFTRSGSAWNQQGPKLTGAGETGNGELGTSAALSGDGSTAIVGGATDDG